MDLFHNALRPRSLKAVEGDPVGVAVGLHRLAGSRLERWLRRKADSDRFVWQGKSFRAVSDLEGWGFNRVGVGPVLEVFPYPDEDRRFGLRW